MKLLKNLWDYLNLNKSDKIITLEPTVIVEKPKPIQKKKEKKPFPYYRFVTEWDEAIDYQCLACKEMFSLGFTPTTLKFCPTCGIEFDGQFSKKNPRYNQYTLKYPYRPQPSVNTFVKIYHRKDIIKNSSDKNMFSRGWDNNDIVPITAERLEYTKDKDNYYKWEEVSRDGIYPFFAHKSSKNILKDQRKRMQYYEKTSKIIQLWAGPVGKERLIKEIIGQDEPYEVGYGLIRCSGFTNSTTACSG